MQRMGTVNTQVSRPIESWGGGGGLKGYTPKGLGIQAAAEQETWSKTRAGYKRNGTTKKSP